MATICLYYMARMSYGIDMPGEWLELPFYANKGTGVVILKRIADSPN